MAKSRKCNESELTPLHVVVSDLPHICPSVSSVYVGNMCLKNVKSSPPSLISLEKILLILKINGINVGYLVGGKFKAQKPRSMLGYPGHFS